ncbi:NAD(P)-dependent alcohol dehydrogenase [Mycobacterium sp. AT1]|uniref:NAD(P)-dependent alcohol dehydrogenase n=1 Tax=Mycobacterium sp. AT1 TaxID=1961706 RepID=UPI0009AE8B79|nr:NAD(P)-dependent alcohol dehydrogenase [Mycobacterium sp. AT1]OPX10656.1 NAD(P)-dependent alcohol dehydrogenase [Mycobacterium sp. AT1]
MLVQSAVVDEVGGPFTIRTVDLAEPGPGEVLVQIAGVGICHTDIAVKEGHLPFPLPGVLGHEGSGSVIAVGAGVERVVVGDKVALSFNSCGSCPQCAKDAPAYCHDFMAYNFGGSRPDGTTGVSESGRQVGANFFGQSSLATHALANERNVVKLPDDAPLSLAGPLGCGIQTGAGAVMNSLDVPAGASLLIAGAGPVGLAAVMAAAVRDADPIIVIEPHEGRRDVALSLGATHVIDPAVAPVADQVRAILAGGVDYAIDTTAAVPVLEQLLRSLGVRGSLGLVGVPANPEAALSIGLIQAQVAGLTVRGIVEGDADPQTFIPYLLDLHRQGRFPFDKLVSTMPFAQINEALEALHRGEAIKVVLVND